AAGSVAIWPVQPLVVQYRLNSVTSRRIGSSDEMSAWHVCLRNVATRTMAFIVFQFLVVVILPNSEVGTSELPAVGAKSVVCSAHGCLAARCNGEPTDFMVLPGIEGTESVARASPLLPVHVPISAINILQLSRRLRI